VIGSAISVVYAKYSSRQLFVNLQNQGRERDRIDMDWGKLQLEYGTVGAPMRVESMAHDDLKMRLPRAEEVVVIKIGGS
jgi:cell division protein FtsL